jgi:cation diffusion facilitator family transporter
MSQKTMPTESEPSPTHTKPHSHEATVVVVAAIISNVFVAIIKIIAALLTRSSAMIAESIHSVVDIGNGLLVAFGMRQSRKPADEHHPFGYGLELYFWTLVVAISIFGIGGGMSLYEGITHLRDPILLEHVTVNYVVLGLSALFEGSALVVAIRNFRRAKGKKRTAYSFIRTSKDPSLFTVVFEDAAAMIGLLMAFLGVFLGQVFDNPHFDGAASVGIGLLLMTVAFFLARESKDLLVGEGVDKHVQTHMEELVLSVDGVKQIGALRSLYLGPNNLLINLDVNFAKGMRAERIDETIAEIENTLTAEYPEVKNIYIEVASLADVAEFQIEKKPHITKIGTAHSPKRNE